jgi:protein-tyrosine phosphatase
MSEILFLCTGNLCRSPSAALFLRQEIGLHGPEGLLVSSAGTLGASDAVPERLIAEAAAFGLNFEGHVPRRMEEADIVRADLVLGMARQHVREAVLLDKPSFAKSFTLREFVRRAQEVGPRGHGPSLAKWLATVHGSRRHLDLIGDSEADDIPDPMGGTSEDYRQMLHEVRELTIALHSLMWD